MPSLIHTYTGRWVDPLDLDPETVCIEDIAHALSNQCRFSGHTREFYSVAQHAYIVSHIVPDELSFDGLMHDAAEAYLQDMAKPLKNDERLGSAYRGAEHRIEKIIGQVFGVQFPLASEVKTADVIALVTEARDLMHGTEQWTLYQDIVPLADTIVPWSPKRARTRFLNRYMALGGAGRAQG